MLRFPKTSKFRAKRTADGFPSKLESSVYGQLLFRERCGEIKDIKRQQTVVLAQGIRWAVDFSFVDVATGETVYAEAKGISTGEYRVKLQLWKNDPPAKLEIWKGNYKRPVLTEVIEPETKGE